MEFVSDRLSATECLSENCGRPQRHDTPSRELSSAASFGRLLGSPRVGSAIDSPPPIFISLNRRSGVLIKQRGQTLYLSFSLFAPSDAESIQSRIVEQSPQSNFVYRGPEKSPAQKRVRTPFLSHAVPTRSL